MPDQNSIVSFLLPSVGHRGDEGFSAILLQWVFLGVICLLAVITMAWVRKSARPANWEENWSGGNGQGANTEYLDAEHGSVHDISGAVATPSEKLAELLPGMLLVIGLLGTFIGLGLALNNASSILQAAGGSGDLAGATKKLMSMMTGLGMKFKTSTWGILGFLLMNVFNAVNGFEKRRLDWAVGKMRLEMNRMRQERLEREREAGRSVAVSIQAVGNQICGWLLKQEKALREIVAANQETSEGIGDFRKTNAKNLESMRTSASTMSEAAGKAKVAAESLTGSVVEFDRGVKEVLQGVKHDLNYTITAMDKGFKEKVSEMSKNLKEATDGISTAVGRLSNEVNQTMGEVRGSVKESLGLQREALLQFSSTVVTLQDNVQKSTENLDKIGSEIASGLRSVSDSGRKMVNLGKDCREVLEEIRMLRSESLDFYETLSANSARPNSGSDRSTSGSMAITNSKRREGVQDEEQGE